MIALGFTALLMLAASDEGWQQIVDCYSQATTEEAISECGKQDKALQVKMNQLQWQRWRQRETEWQQRETESRRTMEECLRRTRTTGEMIECDKQWNERGQERGREVHDLQASEKKELARFQAARELARVQAAIDDARARVEKLKQAKEQSDAERLQEILANPKFLRLGWSAVRCSWQNSRDAAVEETKTERRYAAEMGGVVDKAKLYDLQLAARHADEHIAAAREALAGLKMKAIPCSDKAVKAFVYCMASAQNEECAQASEARIVEAMCQLDRALGSCR